MRARQEKLHVNPLRVSATKVGGSLSQLALAAPPSLRIAGFSACPRPGSGLEDAAPQALLANSGPRQPDNLLAGDAIRGVKNWPAGGGTRNPPSKCQNGAAAGQAAPFTGKDGKYRTAGASGPPPAGPRACVRSDRCRWRSGVPSAAHPSQACGRSGHDPGCGSDRRRR
jgi:hypothetical protein